MTDVRFMYLKDPRCPQRVVSIARYIEGNTLYVTWCINRVRYYTEHYKSSENTLVYRTTICVDEVFDKQKAHCVCKGRLRVGKMVTTSLTDKTNRHIIEKTMEAVWNNCGKAVGLPDVRSALRACALHGKDVPIRPIKVVVED